MSIISEAFAQTAVVRAEFALYREEYRDRAEAATNGYLLNSRGQAAGISPDLLFRCNPSTFAAYASEELSEWTRDNPRMTYPQFEAAHPEAEAWT